MLRREVLDRHGESVRSVGFVEVKKLGGARSAAPATPKAKHGAPKKLGSVPKGYDAPVQIGTRYVLVGRYLRDDGTVQLYYSDGLFGISLFEQRGALDWNGLPRRWRRCRASATTAVATTKWPAAPCSCGSTATSRSPRCRTPRCATCKRSQSTFGRQSGDGGGVVDDIADFVLGPFGFR